MVAELADDLQSAGARAMLIGWAMRDTLAAFGAGYAEGLDLETTDRP